MTSSRFTVCTFLSASGRRLPQQHLNQPAVPIRYRASSRCLRLFHRVGDPARSGFWMPDTSAVVLAGRPVAASAPHPVHPPGSRKRQIEELEGQLARGEPLSKNARKKLAKLRYQVEVLPGRRQALSQQREEKNKAKKERRRARAAAGEGSPEWGGEEPFSWTSQRSPRATGFDFFQALG